MSTHHIETDRIRQNLLKRWRVLATAYDKVNHITHHALSWLVVFLLVLYFAFCGVFLSLRYLVLPHIDNYKPEVEQLASRFIQRPVTINGIYASWRGLNPHLRLDNVVIHNNLGERALILPEVNATLSWWSVLGELRLKKLEIARPDLEVERDAEGRIYVAGLLLDINQKDNGQGLDWLLSQREISLRGGWLRWRDAQRKAPELVLNNISFTLKNQWLSHKMALQATPPEALAAPIDLRAEFKHPTLSGKKSDFSQWVGEVYLDWHNTRLDAWKPYIDLPWEISGGDGSVQAWLNFNRGAVVNLTADLSLANVSARLATGLAPLNLLEVSGRISLGEVATSLKERLLSFGTQGYAITLKDFSLRTEQGTVLPRTTVSHHHIPATAGRPERYELKITELDLEALAKLAVHLPISAQERQMLYDFAPHGQLSNFSAAWQGALPNIDKFQVSGDFSQLTLRQQIPRSANGAEQAQQSFPGFEGLSGEIDANQDGGRIKLRGEHTTLYLANYLADPTLSLDELTLDGSWSLQNRQQLALKVDSLNFSQSGLKGHLEGAHVMPWPVMKDKLGHIDLKASFPKVDLQRVAEFLPATAIDANDWMNLAIQDGYASDVSVIVKGDLDKFPFTQKRASEHVDGVFKITGKIHQAKIIPAPKELAQDKRTPLWPKIEEIEGSITLDSSRLHIRADTAKTLGLPLTAVDVVIADYFSHGAMLDVTGSAVGGLPLMLNYVNATPVAGWLDGLTEEARVTGNARLNLKLQLPLTEIGQPAAQGSLRFAGNEVQLWNALPMVQQLSGDLGFSEKGFQLTGMHGNFLGGPLAINGGTLRDGSTQVKLDGMLSTEGLSRLNVAPVAKKILKKLNGSTRFAATIKVKNQRPELTLESSLSGLAIDLPAPLQKAPSELMPLRLTILPVGLYEQLMQTEEIRLSLGRSINARYLRQRPNARTANWKLLRGSLGVNLSPPMPDNGIAMAINMPSLNADAWRNLVSGMTNESGSDGEAASGNDLSAYLTPDSVSLRTNELTIDDRVLQNTVMGASRLRAGWQFNIHSDDMIGHALWEDPLSERGAGKLTARLTLLKFEQSAVSEVTDILSGKKTSGELPGLDVIADNFELRGMKLGRLELAATNAGMTTGPGREWRISKLMISNPDATMHASGRWLAGIAGSQTSLNYELEILDAGRLLDRTGFERALKGGKGKLEGDLSWRGGPSSFDFPSMSGNLTLKLASGQFLKADPGVGKLLGVMSLQALPRRLTLDFRDMFSEGFSFDTIASTATVTRGILKTDSFKMRGVNAVVLMDGTVDLNEETQNLNVVVIPELNAGGASVVYALAVNPVIGLGSFLAQLFLRSPLSQALTQDYQVTGPWKDPMVKKVASRRKASPEQDKPVVQ